MPQRNIRQESAPTIVVRSVARLGANIAQARLRRRLSQLALARKAGIAINTLRGIEAGSLGASMGACVSVLWALGLHRTLRDVADPDRDREGIALENARFPQRARVITKISDDF